MLLTSFVTADIRIDSEHLRRMFYIIFAFLKSLEIITQEIFTQCFQPFSLLMRFWPWKEENGTILLRGPTVVYTRHHFRYLFILTRNAKFNNKYVQLRIITTSPVDRFYVIRHAILWFDVYASIHLSSYLAWASRYIRTHTLTCQKPVKCTN